MTRTYDHIMRAVMDGDLELLELYHEIYPDFPCGKDDFVNRHWITNAVDCGPLSSVQWMLNKNVDLRFRDDEGYTILHSAIDREQADKMAVMELLIFMGADLNAHGTNGWTPTHMAACRNDIEALELLIACGADLTIRTSIDDYATPLEEAKLFGDCNDEIIDALANPLSIKTMKKFKTIQQTMKSQAHLRAQKQQP